MIQLADVRFGSFELLQCTLIQGFSLVGLLNNLIFLLDNFNGIIESFKIILLLITIRLPLVKFYYNVLIPDYFLFII